MVVVVVVCNAPRGFSTLVRERRAFLHAFAPAIINLELLRDYSECYAPMRTENEIRVSALLYWLCRLPPSSLAPPFLSRKPGENCFFFFSALSKKRAPKQNFPTE